ncbi:hypothetical protein [Burkholderia arboris]|uniref:hypothetical protein n=1 Tax=Burkholderia arboris TaxID=488730 RepID=UPI0015833195|nr:hypothetical protein [Burkholderia arboris]UTV60551.1 hypothetical protein NLX30_35825 [Burkholderia arboris]
MHLATPRRAFLSNVVRASYSIGLVVQMADAGLNEIPRLLPSFVRRNGRFRYTGAVGADESRLFIAAGVCHDAAHDDPEHHDLAAPSSRPPSIAPWFVSHLDIASGTFPIRTTTKAPPAPFLFFAPSKPAVPINR